MSRENVEIVQRWIDAYNRRDMEGLIEVIEPDFEFRSIFVSVESVFQGRERFPGSSETTSETRLSDAGGTQ